MRIFKTVLGAILAIFIAQALGLRFALTAGVLVILSLQDSRKKSKDFAVLRLKATALALAVATPVFLAVGFTPFAFGIYLAIYLPLASKAGLADGILVGSVLVTHLLGEEDVSWAMWLNSFALMAIGVGLAMLSNVYMPQLRLKIRSDQGEIEARFREILNILALKAAQESQPGQEKDQAYFQRLEHLLGRASRQAELNRENFYSEEMTYYTQYMTMRFLQFEVLKRMGAVLDKVDSYQGLSGTIAHLIRGIAADFSEFNDGEMAIYGIDQVLGLARQQELPKSRHEFENRAHLFHFLLEFRHFIEIKHEFFESLRSCKPAFLDLEN